MDFIAILLMVLIVPGVLGVVAGVVGFVGAKAAIPAPVFSASQRGVSAANT